MPKKIDLTGQVFGRLTAIRPIPSIRPPKKFWECLCECGEITAREVSQLRLGKAKSCGCLKREMNAGNTYSVKHGQHQTRTYASWDALKQRCQNPNNTSYDRYGGRGIKVCERWLSYENFLADMGERPPGKTVDRIDVNGDYEPGNCRWATGREQSNNRRDNVMVTLPDGRTMTLTQAALALGLNEKTVHARWSKSKDLSIVLRPIAPRGGRQS